MTDTVDQVAAERNAAMARPPAPPTPVDPDPAVPIEDVQQRELPIPPAVPVRVEGPVLVRIQPARSGPVVITPLSATDPASVLPEDMRRSFATLLADVDWFYMRSSNGQRVPWPASVPLQISHADAVWALAVEEEGTLSTITEIYAD